MQFIQITFPSCVQNRKSAHTVQWGFRTWHEHNTNIIANINNCLLIIFINSISMMVFADENENSILITVILQINSRTVFIQFFFFYISSFLISGWRGRGRCSKGCPLYFCTTFSLYFTKLFVLCHRKIINNTQIFPI